MKDEFMLILMGIITLVVASIVWNDTLAFIGCLFACTAFIVRALGKLANK